MSHAAIPLETGRPAREVVIDATVLAAQQGSEAAFASLYDAHAGRVYALCLRLSADRVLAEELVQDVFVRMWQRLSSFRGESAFGTWLHRLALNTVLESGRKGLRRRLRVQIAADFANMETDHDAATPAPDLHQQIDLEAAVATLPAGARAVWVLHDVEGYGHAEIGSILGVAEGTSKAHLFRARRLLRQRLMR
ncbi:MAG: RNA polymerase sigma factor [Gemmatimonadota bacterium]